MFGNILFGVRLLGDYRGRHESRDEGQAFHALAIAKELAVTDSAACVDVPATEKYLQFADFGSGVDESSADKHLAPADESSGSEALEVVGHLSVGIAQSRSRLRPIYLVEISLLNGGQTLHFCDQSATIRGQLYENYLESISGLGDEIHRSAPSASTIGPALRFRNDRFNSWTHLIEAMEDCPLDGAPVTIREVYLDDDGKPSEDVTLFAGVIEEPRDITRAGFVCRVSTPDVQRDRQWRQNRVSATEYPDAYEDLGRIIPVIYGSDILVPALRVAWGARTTLAEAVTDGPLSVIQVSDAERLPSSGYVWVDEEKMHYTSRSGNSLTGLSRGQGGTQAAAHNRGSLVWQHLDRYDSVVADHPLRSVGDVFAEVDGHLVRVTSGVSDLVEGGRHLLRATECVTLKPADDQTDVLDSLGITEPGHQHQADDGRETLPMENWELVNRRLITSMDPSAGIDGDQESAASFRVSSCGDPPCTGTVTYRVGRATDFDTGGAIKEVRLAIKSLGTGNGEYRCSWHGASIANYETWGGPKTITRVATSIGPNDWHKLKDPVDVDVVVTHTGQGTPEMLIHEVWLEITYTPAAPASTAGVSRTGQVSKDGQVVVSLRTVERFHARVEGYQDTNGHFGGLGALIERPDHIIKHFLVHRFGFGLDEIDDLAFAASGDSFASAVPGGYRFGFALDGPIRPSEFLRRLAYESRSTLIYRAGRWRLDYVPDAAPPPVKTITASEVAGRFGQFRFSRTSLDDLANQLAARYRRNYSLVGSESAWDATAEVSDAASVAKYGAYPGDVELVAVREQATAEHVLNHMLRERKAPLLMVTLSVLWDHFDLRAGDTIELENYFFSGRRFFIERMERTGKGTVEITAREWWA